MEFLVVGYPFGDGRYIELGRIIGDSKEEVFKKIDKSIWYNYYVIEFNQQKYDELKSSHNIEMRFK